MVARVGRKLEWSAFSQVVTPDVAKAAEKAIGGQRSVGSAELLRLADTFADGSVQRCELQALAVALGGKVATPGAPPGFTFRAGPAAQTHAASAARPLPKLDYSKPFPGVSPLYEVYGEAYKLTYSPHTDHAFVHLKGGRHSGAFLIIRPSDGAVLHHGVYPGGRAHVVFDPTGRRFAVVSTWEPNAVAVYDLKTFALENYKEGASPDRWSECGQYLGTNRGGAQSVDGKTNVDPAKVAWPDENGSVELRRGTYEAVHRQSGYSVHPRFSDTDGMHNLTARWNQRADRFVIVGHNSPPALFKRDGTRVGELSGNLIGFTPDGKHVVTTAHGPRSVRIYDADSGTLKLDLDVDAALPADQRGGNYGLEVSFSHDGRRLRVAVRQSELYWTFSEPGAKAAAASS